MSDGLIVELAVADPGACPVAATAADADEPVTSVSRAVAPDGEGRLAEEFALPSGASVEAGVDSVVDADAPDLDRVASMADRDVYRFTRDPAAPCVCDRLEGIVGPVSDVRARDGTLFVTARARELSVLSEAVSDLRDAFDGVRVTRLRRSGDDGDDLVLVDRAALTERQREVLETAHAMGYFEYPKGANAGDVADALDISPSTFAEHLAAAQGKLLDAVVAE